MKMHDYLAAASVYVLAFASIGSAAPPEVRPLRLIFITCCKDAAFFQPVKKGMADAAKAMNGPGKSDRPVVPPKPPNKGDGAPSPAEGIEGRGLAKENLLRQNQSIGHRAAPDWPNELERIRQAAKKGVYHPHPDQRLRVRIYGKSPVR